MATRTSAPTERSFARASVAICSRSCSSTSTVTVDGICFSEITLDMLQVYPTILRIRETANSIARVDSERRQWPVDEMRLERLAFRAGLDADELRELLRSEISARRASAHAADGRFPLRSTPTAEERAWAATQPKEIQDAVEAFLTSSTARPVPHSCPKRPERAQIGFRMNTRLETAQAL